MNAPRPPRAWTRQPCLRAHNLMRSKGAPTRCRRLLMWAAVPLLALAAGGCSPTPPPMASSGLRAEAVTTRTLGTTTPASPSRDLSADESVGGHTLTRHVGRSDVELGDRLRREPQISSASTYTDRAAAERAVGGAIAAADGRIRTWRARTGRRPNLVLDYADPSRQPLGRSLSRGERAPVSCYRAVVVLRWNERENRFYVLTSYPEAGR